MEIGRWEPLTESEDRRLDMTFWTNQHLVALLERNGLKAAGEPVGQALARVEAGGVQVAVQWVEAHQAARLGLQPAPPPSGWPHVACR